MQAINAINAALEYVRAVDRHLADPLSLVCRVFTDEYSLLTELAGETPCNASGGQIFWDFVFDYILDCATAAKTQWNPNPLENRNFRLVYSLEINPLTVFYLRDRIGYLFADQLKQIWHARILDVVADDKLVADIMASCFEVTADRINVYVPQLQLDQL